MDAEHRSKCSLGVSRLRPPLFLNRPLTNLFVTIFGSLPPYPPKIRVGGEVSVFFHSYIITAGTSRGGRLMSFDVLA